MIWPASCRLRPAATLLSGHRTRGKGRIIPITIRASTLTRTLCPSRLKCSRAQPWISWVKHCSKISWEGEKFSIFHPPNLFLSRLKDFVDLFEEVMGIGEAIVDGVGLPMLVQQHGGWDGQHLVMVCYLSFSRGINLGDGDRIATSRQHAFQSWRLQLMALMAIFAAEGQDMHARLVRLDA